MILETPIRHGASRPGFRARAFGASRNDPGELRALKAKPPPGSGRRFVGWL